MFQRTSAVPSYNRALYLMSKPPVQQRGVVAKMPRYPSVRNPGLLHLTILALADGREESLPRFIELMDGFGAYAFHVKFDRIIESRVVALSSRKRLQRAEEFQQQLVQFLQRGGFTSFSSPPKPHVTLRYGRDGMGNEMIPSIGWKVDEVLLIESLVGRATHIERGRWQLEPLLI